MIISFNFIILLDLNYDFVHIHEMTFDFPFLTVSQFTKTEPCHSNGTLNHYGKTRFKFEIDIICFISVQMM